MESFSKSGGNSFQLCMSDFRSKVRKLIKLHIVIITITSTPDIISISSFTVPRKQRNLFVTKYVQVVFNLNSTKQTQFTAPLTSGL